MTDVRSRKLTIGSRQKASTQSKSQERAERSIDRGDAVLTTSARLHSICIVTALIAASIFTLTEHDDHRLTFWCAFEMIVQTALVIIGTIFFRTRLKLLHDTSVVQPILVMVVTLTLLCEPFQRFFLGHGHPFEVMVMHSQSNLMLALAVCGFRIAFQRLALLIAVFLAIFSCTISNAPAIFPLTILFAIGCLVWLVASWWETVDRRLTSSESRRGPLLWLATGVGAPLLLLLTTAAFGANTVTTAFKGFMPSSGGTGDFDPFSRGGVKDGDALVAGNENIKAFAPLDDAPFLESDKPSLYDMFNDMFDEPPKKIKEQQRAIALPPELLKHVHQKMAEAKQAGREFSILRTNVTADKKRIHDLDTHAMFYVAGRVPSRFRMEVYEHFDGLTWFPMDGPQHPKPVHPCIKQIGDRPWLSIPLQGRGLEIHSGSETHSVKVANLDGNVIPSPPHVVGVSIDHVDRKDMYSVSAGNLVSLQRKSVPEMTPINVTSEYVDRSTLPQNCGTSLAIRSADVTNQLPEDSYSGRIRQLAAQWTEGVPRGWLQVVAIENGLRQNYTVDREAKPSANMASPVGEFLFESKRGPEYLFASSAACLLRSLGYSTRMVSGFYAHPDNYDKRKQHTAVMAANAHFWCEVLVGLDTWVTIEPSPGYALPGPPLGLISRLLQSAYQAWLVAIANAFLLVAAVFLAVVLFVYRHHIYERITTWRWRWFGTGRPQERIVSLAALIDYRLMVAGKPRPAGTTLLRWSRNTDLMHVRSALQQLVAVATEARFAPKMTSEVEADQSEAQWEELKLLEQTLTVRSLRCPTPPTPLAGPSLQLSQNSLTP